MNVDCMPELHWTFGYPAVVAFTATVWVFIFRAFRRNDWL
ncbi:CorA family divalent cation transporter [Kitasatospora sp. NPDC054768]